MPGSHFRAVSRPFRAVFRPFSAHRKRVSASGRAKRGWDWGRGTEKHRRNSRIEARFEGKSLNPRKRSQNREKPNLRERSQKSHLWREKAPALGRGKKPQPTGKVQNEGKSPSLRREKAPALGEGKSPIPIDQGHVVPVVVGGGGGQPLTPHAHTRAHTHARPSARNRSGQLPGRPPGPALARYWSKPFKAMRTTLFTPFHLLAVMDREELKKRLAGIGQERWCTMMRASGLMWLLDYVIREGKKAQGGRIDFGGAGSRFCFEDKAACRWDGS